MVGMLGPKISASRRDIQEEELIFDRARDKLTAVVDFPTPPFPDATSMTFFTPSIVFLLGNPLAINSVCLFFNNSSFDD